MLIGKYVKGMLGCCIHEKRLDFQTAGELHSHCRKGCTNLLFTLHADGTEEVDAEAAESPHAAAVMASTAPEGLLSALKTVSWFQVMLD